MRLDFLYSLLFVVLLKLFALCFYFSKSEDIPVLKLKDENNSESAFACGKKISLSRSDLFDLELIPGISDKLAGEIILKRSEIISMAGQKKLGSGKCSGRICQPISPFELVHGVGKLTAEKLEKFIIIN